MPTPINIIFPGSNPHAGPHDRIRDQPHKLVQVDIIAIVDKLLFQLLDGLLLELDYQIMYAR